MTGLIVEVPHHLSWSQANSLVGSYCAGDPAFRNGGCCGDCQGTGTGSEGMCWDCRGTGHPHEQVEEWRPAPGLVGYEVSSEGRARSWRNRRGWPLEEPVLVGYWRRGYLLLNPNRRGREYRVHRLVCEAFNGPAPFEGAVCRHLDDDKSNNRPGNLAWGTHADNVADRVRNGKNGKIPGPRKLTEDKVRDIRERFNPKHSWNPLFGGRWETNIRDLAVEYGVTWECVAAIVKRKTWKDV